MNRVELGAANLGLEVDEYKQLAQTCFDLECLGMNGLFEAVEQASHAFGDMSLALYGINVLPSTKEINKRQGKQGSRRRNRRK